MTAGGAGGAARAATFDVRQGYAGYRRAERWVIIGRSSALAGASAPVALHPAAKGVAMRTLGTAPTGGPGELSIDDELEVRGEDPSGEASELESSTRLPSAPVTGALRDGFVVAFNERDLDGLLALCHPGVECPDLHGDGGDVLADELTAVWERAPGVLLTEGHLGDEPCAVAWLPAEDGRWSPAALVRFEVAGERLTLVGLHEDADALAAVEAWAPPPVEASPDEPAPP